MTTEQILLYTVVLLVAALYVRRLMRMRSIKNYSPRELQERLQRAPHPVLLDVRTAAERQTGAIKGSLHIPVQELRRRESELEKHREREVICYCQSGSRSISAALALKKLGYNAGNLRGGIADWNFTHLPAKR